MRDTIDMAREVGLLDGRDDWSSVPEEYMTCIKDFEAIVRADEREATILHTIESGFIPAAYREDFATAIRARGETK